nr:hypothetical protein [Tanacetum cinerariifolium]
MESLSPQVVASAKLHVLNPNEFDLWNIIIEQYFLMTDYSLWEAILNGYSLIPTKIVDGVVQVIAPTTAEQQLAKKNKLKASGTLLMALPDKHQLKFNIHKDDKSLIIKKQRKLQNLISQLEILGESISQEGINLKFLRSLPSKWKTHTLIWRNKANLEEQSLVDLFNNLKIYEAEVKGSSTSSHNTQNITFVSLNNTNSTNELVNVVPSVSAAIYQALVFTLPNVDSLSDAVIYSFFASLSNSPQFENEDLKQIDADYLEEMDLKWHMAMLTMRRKRFLQKTEMHLGVNGTYSIGFDMSNVECYNCHRIGHFSRDCRSPRDTRNKDTPRRTVPLKVSSSKALMTQCDVIGSYDWIFQADEEPTNYVFMAYASLGSSSSSRSENKCIRYKSGEGYHVVPPTYTGTFMPPKPNLVINDAPIASETVTNVLTVESSSHTPKLLRHVSTDVPHATVKRSPRPVTHVVHKAHSPIRRPINYRRATKTRNFNHKVTTVQVNKVTAIKGNEERWV